MGVDALRGEDRRCTTATHPVIALQPLPDLLVEEPSRCIEHCAQQAGVRDLVMARCCALYPFRVRLTPRPPMRLSGYNPFTLLIPPP
jgi:hypothetical protein